MTPIGVTQSPIPSDKASTITGSSGLMHKDEDHAPRPEVNETDILQTHVSKSPRAREDQGGEVEEKVGGSGEIPDMPMPGTVEGNENGANGGDGDNKRRSRPTAALLRRQQRKW